MRTATASNQKYNYNMKNEEKKSLLDALKKYFDENMHIIAGGLSVLNGNFYTYTAFCDRDRK